MAKELAIIVDVDGTLADMRGVRGPFEWLKVSQDKPHQDIIDLVKDLSFIEVDTGEYESRIEYGDEYHDPIYDKKYKIIIVTGRDGICEESTKVWLEHYKIPYDEFFIRPEGDFRKDNIIKSEIYMDHIRPKYDVKFVIDDRDQVVDMWRSLGLRVLQVAPGNF